MALKKSDLYASLWASCDELRGGMDASQYKDYVLTLLFVKYVSDRAVADPNSLIEVPRDGSFAAMEAAKGSAEIGDQCNKIIARLAKANDLTNVIDLADFNDEEKLGKGKEMVDRLTKLVTIFSELDFSTSSAQGDDLLGDAYEYLMRHFATESGKSKGQFYTPAEVSRVLAKVVGIGPDTSQDETVYDPACGSGSLLLKAADEAPGGMSIYGQEKDNATWALCKMNMILHNNAIAEIAKGDTITSPEFTNGAKLKTFDYVVMNPPFSVKSWRNGLEHDFGRFVYGEPPDKNGDYAFLLHALASLKSTGSAAIVLPHGVLFRGNAEGAIRTKLLQHGFVKGVIGLPPNLFYGTGIPACVVVLDKAEAAHRDGVFMIDASRGFAKDGAKNRLRSRDLHQIVDTFNQQREVPGYSRLVQLAEIADERNDYNLNIPRYIDSSEPEDLQDLDAHLHGGIPERDIDALEAYWRAFPDLRATLFEPFRPGYVQLAVEPNEVHRTILDAPSFVEFREVAREMVEKWFGAHRPMLAEIDATTDTQALINSISVDLLDRFERVALIDRYAVYEALMSYWHDTMHDDVFLVMNSGWGSAAAPRAALTTKDRKVAEEPDLTVGKGRAAKKFKMDLIPPGLVVARWFAEEQAEIDRLAADVEAASAALAEHAEEHGGDEGLLAEATNDKGAYTKALVTALAKEAKASQDDETLACAQEALALVNTEAKAKKVLKEAKSALDATTLQRYGSLTAAEVESLVLDDKWRATIADRVTAEVDALTLKLVRRIRELGDRYAQTVAELDTELDDLEAKVAAHLTEMGLRP